MALKFCNGIISIIIYIIITLAKRSDTKAWDNTKNLSKHSLTGDHLISFYQGFKFSQNFYQGFKFFQKFFPKSLMSDILGSTS